MTILFLGPLPPPTHGFASINAAMLARLQAVTEVVVFDRSPGKTHHRGRIGKQLQIVFHTGALLIRFVVVIICQRPRDLYMGLSGGVGQFLDLPFLLLSRLARIRMTVHHHSFAYLQERSILASICMCTVSKARHIVLCEHMASRLQSLYGVAQSNVFQLSNAAFFPVSGMPIPAEHVAEGKPAVRIGFLSAITAEKGIFRFLEVIQLACSHGLELEASVVGPVDELVERRFYGKMNQIPEVKHLGALYGDDKRCFYHAIDILLFPSNYINEAEPVTLSEALEAGVEVVAISRGCIEGMLPDGCGQTVSAAQYSSVALATIRRFYAMPFADKLRQRISIQQRFREMQELNARRLSELVECVS